jgi:hypothetical protein
LLTKSDAADAVKLKIAHFRLKLLLIPLLKRNDINPSVNFT